jgi:hypothetical protein
MTAVFDSAKAIITRFDTVWAAAHAGFPIVHDNQHYELIEGSDFVYISVQFTGANAISLGGPDTSLIGHISLLEINFYTALAKCSELRTSRRAHTNPAQKLHQFLSSGLPRSGMELSS